MSKWRERARSIVDTTLSQRKTLDNSSIETDNIKTKDTETEEIKVAKNWRQKLFAQRKRIGVGKQTWKRVNWVGIFFRKSESPTMGEIIISVFGILIILTVVSLYILGLFFEVGDWLGSIVETVTFFVNGFSRVFFHSVSHG
ncbi:hypothetical protein ACN4EE_01580 [Geminocystis sp. CENA526]|uniref:hypothetical protein n=1 Tax=Geminocystis sp. CENA526 TaxID=1355871 RepID=UPI003D6E493B